jgi:hypothetical protein
MTNRSQSEAKHSRQKGPKPAHKANLGQLDAGIEKESDEQLEHMEGGKAADNARERKEKFERQ